MPASPEAAGGGQGASSGRHPAPCWSRGAARRGTFIAPGAIATIALLASIALTTTGGATGRLRYPALPPPAHTGGFGEPTCHVCHFEARPNEPGGTLALRGVPDSYSPGESYTLTVFLTRAEMESAGFQISARFATGPHAGTQAGELYPLDERSAITIAGEPGVHYLHHSEVGTRLETPDTARWTFEWVAPVAGAQPVSGARPPNGTVPKDGARPRTESVPSESTTVVFHLVANAADGDESPFGDLIYTSSREVHPRRVVGTFQ